VGNWEWRSFGGEGEEGGRKGKEREGRGLKWKEAELLLDEKEVRAYLDKFLGQHSGHGVRVEKPGHVRDETWPVKYQRKRHVHLRQGSGCQPLPQVRNNRNHRHPAVAGRHFKLGCEEEEEGEMKKKKKKKKKWRRRNEEEEKKEEEEEKARQTLL
jgi:hypothetical protein